MRVKTLIELLTLSASVYHLAKDSQFIDRISQLTDKGREDFNKFASEPLVDEDGKELELIDKIILKANELKEEMDEKMEELVVNFYKKINVTHADEMRAMEARLAESDKVIALMEARLNRMEAKQ